MNKLEAEDPCPCGSEKEYQACCSPENEFDFYHQDNHWQKEEVEVLSTGTIISRLKLFGVDFDKEEFIADCQRLGSAEEVSELWFEKYNIKVKGFDNDFLWFAAWILGKRLTNDQFILDEELYKLINSGYQFIENDNYQKGCDIWLEAWKKFREKTIYPEKYNSIRNMNQDCKADMFIQNWINDLDMNLEIAGQRGGKHYWQKRVEYCHDVYQIFPESEDKIIKDMKKGEAQSYFAIGKTEKGEALFEQLLDEYPDWAWGYVHWGDIYNPYYSSNYETNEQKSYQLYKKANQVHSQKKEEDFSVVEERLIDFPKNDLTEKDCISPDLVFNKKDYLDFCEHDDQIIQEWAYRQLTRNFPQGEETLDYTLDFLTDNRKQDSSSFMYTIYSFFEKHFEKISAEKVFVFLQENNNLSKENRVLLLKFLAKKQYHPDEVVNMILDIFSNGNLDYRTFSELVEALVNLETEEAYQILKNIGSEQIKPGITESYFSSLLTYRKEEDLEQITELTLENLNKINYELLFYDLCELYYGREYVYRINKFYYTDNLEEIAENLKNDWPNNPAVKSFSHLIEEQFITTSEKWDQKAIFERLINLIESILTEKYNLSLFEEFTGITLNQLQQFRNDLSSEDFWITYLCSQIKDYQDHIFQEETEEFFIYVLISMLIVLKENIGFKHIVELVQDDEELLWEIFTLGREKIPEQIIEIVEGKGTGFEKQALQFIEDKEYHLAIPRVLAYLGTINSNQAVPEIISLAHEDQGDLICESVEETLNEIDNIPLSVVESGMLRGDEITCLYASTVLENYPCDYSAEILIDLYKRGQYGYPEAFVSSMQKIGAEAGLKYLQKAEFTHHPPNLNETLYILSVVHEKPEIKIRKYRRRLKKGKNERNTELNVRKKDQQTSQLKEGYVRTEEGTIIRQGEEVGRNDPCPCGSGKKYKKCCGR